jgi:hypothetical protein
MQYQNEYLVYWMMLMSELLFVKFLHIIGLVYWLGGDLGVFYSSFIVSDEKAAPNVRLAAGQMLFALDQAPRICMTMMLPLGLHLAWLHGALTFSSGIMLGIWLVAFAWMASVLFLHFGSGTTAKAIVTRIDYWFRVVVIVTLIYKGASSLLGDSDALPYWIAWKLIIFGILISLGLTVRIVLKDFGPAFAKVAAGNPDDAANAAIRQGLGRTRPFVVCIWIGLLISTALGLHLI